MKSFDRISSLHMMVGVLQAILAYGLFQSAELEVWPATHAAAYVPLFMLMVALPLAFYCASEAAAVRRWLLSLGLGLLATLIGLHQGLTAGVSLWQPEGYLGGWSPGRVGDYLQPALIFSLLVFLVAPAVALIRGRPQSTDYQRWIDALHHNALVLLQAALVLGLFWGLLYSAAGLFKLVGLDLLHDLIEQSWFSIPLITLVFSHAVSVAVRTRGVAEFLTGRARQLCGWLYPLAALLAVGFVLSWGVQGLAGLFDSGHAAHLLFWFVTLNLLLINLASRGGAEHGVQAVWLHWVMVAGKLALLPMMAVAGYALWLRLAQYGLTPERIWALLVWLVLSVMALGTALDALSSARGSTPNRLLPFSNVAAAVLAGLGIVLLLGGPIDPRRLSVESQLLRHETNRLSDDALIDFLRYQGDGYGLEVLTDLTRADTDGDKQAQRLALLARKALAGRREGSATLLDQVKDLPRFPSGSVLPTGLAQALGRESGVLSCNSQQLDLPDACLIWALPDFAGEQTAYIVLRRDGDSEMPFGRIWLPDADGNWVVSGDVGRAQDANGCPLDHRPAALFDAVVQNRVEFAAKPQPDLMVNGLRIPTNLWRNATCP